MRRSNTKNLPYYFQAATKDSRWEPPAGTDPEKLKQYMASHHSSKGVAPAAFAPAKDKIRCAHLLVKHADSRRPASWREPKITRSKEDAIQLIKGYEAQIRAYEDGTGAADAKSLSELATTESDCSSARKGGDLLVLRLPSQSRSSSRAAGVSLVKAICKPSLSARRLTCKRAKSAQSSTRLREST